MEPLPYSCGSLELRRAPPFTLLTWDSGVLTAPGQPAPAAVLKQPAGEKLAAPSACSASGRGGLPRSRGRPGDLSCAAQSAPRGSVGCAWLSRWLGPSGGAGLEATRLVMCSLYVGGPALVGAMTGERKVGSEPPPCPSHTG